MSGSNAFWAAMFLILVSGAAVLVALKSYRDKCPLLLKGVLKEEVAKKRWVLNTHNTVLVLFSIVIELAAIALLMSSVTTG